MTSVLDAALGYAAAGFKVIAVDGKKPFLPAWQQQATTQAETIREWWRDFPRANVGICPDERFCILDIDTDKGGDESIAAIERQFGALPTTIISRTGGGGSHQYYRRDPARKLKYKPAKGVEILGIGRQAVEWPSVHPETGVIYEWQDAAPTDPALLPTAPDWFYEPARAERPNGSATASSETQFYRYCRVALENQRVHLAGRTSGDRNNALNIAALKLATLAHYGAFTEFEAEASLRAASEQNGLVQDDGLKAFEATFHSGWSAGLANPHEIPERPDFRSVHGRASPIDAPSQDEGDRPAEGYTDAWARPLADTALSSIPPRQWLYGVKLIRQHTTLIVSPGGVGKTALTFGIALACATGRQLLHDKPHRPLRVWIYNLEEPYDELRRRLKAACLHFGAAAPFDEIKDRIFLNSGRDLRANGDSGILNVAIKDESGAVIITPDVDKMIAEIKRLEIDVVEIDPFVMTHQTEENSNADGERVLREFNRIAHEANCSIVLVHHTRKGFIPGDMDSIRGASSLTGAARVAFTLAPMSEDDSRALNISTQDRRFLVRLDDAKMNLAPKAEKSQWLKLESINLENGDNEYPHGDNVQVATIWQPPDEIKWLTVEVANAFLDILAAGQSKQGEEVERYSLRKTADRWAADRFCEFMSDRSHPIKAHEANDVLRSWASAKPPVITEREYHSTNSRKAKKGIFVNAANRPGIRLG